LGKEWYAQLSRKDGTPSDVATTAEVDGADSEEIERRNHEPEANLHLLRVRITAARSSVPLSKIRLCCYHSPRRALTRCTCTISPMATTVGRVALMSCSRGMMLRGTSWHGAL
jgi:hypothetical protein